MREVLLGMNNSTKLVIVQFLNWNRSSSDAASARFCSALRARVRGLLIQCQERASDEGGGGWERKQMPHQAPEGF